MDYFSYIFFAVGILLVAVLWLIVSRRELALLRSDLEQADRQLTMHRALALQARDGPNERAAREMLDTSRMLYRDSATAYNLALKKLLNRLPARILGYRPTTGEAEI